MAWQAKQRGASFIGLTLTLVIIAYAVFLVIQYTPQHIEAAQVRTLLDAVREQSLARPYRGADEVWAAIDRQLYINEMSRMKEHFDVTPRGGGGWIVSVRYERELDLLFRTARMPHDYSIGAR